MLQKLISLIQSDSHPKVNVRLSM